MNIPKLNNQRLYLKLAQIVHQLCDFPKDVIQSQIAHSNRLARDLTLHCPFAYTNYYYPLFVPSSVRTWNSLDETLVNSPSLHSWVEPLEMNIKIEQELNFVDNSWLFLDAQEANDSYLFLEAQEAKKVSKRTVVQWM